MTRWLCWFAHAWTPWRLRRLRVTGFRTPGLEELETHDSLETRACNRCGHQQARDPG